MKIGNGKWSNLFKKEEETWSVGDEIPQEHVVESGVAPEPDMENPVQNSQWAQTASTDTGSEQENSGSSGYVSSFDMVDQKEETDGSLASVPTENMLPELPVEKGKEKKQKRPFRKKSKSEATAGESSKKQKNWKVLIPMTAILLCLFTGACALLWTDLPFMFRVNNDGVLTGYYGIGGRVAIPDSVTTIGEEAFADRHLLFSVSMPESVKEIKERAFEGCTNLRKAALPEELTGVGEYAFADCTHLKQTSIPDTITYLGSGVYQNCTKLEGVTFPSGLTEIPDAMFMGCGNLKELSLPKHLESLGSMALSGCSSLKTLTLPNSLSYIGGDAFAGCSKLTELQIPEGVTQIYWRTFQNCTGLKRVTLSEQTRVIREEAFEGCTNLSQINLPDTLVEVGNRAFEGCDALKLDPFLINDTGVLLAYLGDSSTVAVPERVTAIGICAFSQNQRIRSVELPGGVTRIGHSAFYGCTRLESITIPDGMVRIDARAFESCDALTQIILPESLKKIGERCFCYSGLTQVYYAGTSVKWKQIEIDEDNEELSAAQMTYQYRK